mgnify:CR=1 FL=1
MKRILRSFFLLLLVIVWSSNALAVTSPYSYTFGKAQNADFTSKNQTTKLDGIDWTLASDAKTIITSANSSGQQIGSNKYPVKNATISTTAIPGTIKSITVTAKAASKDAKMSLSVLVNNVQYGNKIDLSRDESNYEFKNNNNLQSGKIEIKFVNSASKGGFYIKNITVTFEEGTSATATTVSFPKESLNLIDGDKATQGQAAVVKAGEKILTGATVTYSFESADGIFKETLASEGLFSLNAGTYGTGKVTATFDGGEIDGVTYAKSSASYIVNYSAAKTPSLTFSVANVTVKQGEESSFVKPTIKFTDERGDDVTESAELTYSVSPEGVVEIEKNSGDITKWLAPGVAKVQAHTDYGYDASYTLTYEKVKLATTLTLDEGLKTTGEIGETLDCPAWTLKAGENVLSGKTVVLTSDSKDVVKVDGNQLKLVAAGSANITLSFNGDDDYQSSNVSYKLTVVDPNALVSTFDFVKNTYGYGRTDKLNKGEIISNRTPITIVNTKNGSSTSTTFRNNDLRNYKDAILTINAAKGYLITKITMTGNRFLQLSLNDNNGTWNKERQTGEWLGSSSSVSFTNLGSDDGNAVSYYTINIEYVAVKPVTLDESQNNTETISGNADKTVNVKLTRTLKADVWNTFCVPFDVTIEGSPLEGATIKQIASVTEKDDGAVINFVDALATLEAGKAYLVRTATAIVNPTFNGVTVKNVTPTNCSGNDNYQLIGIYSPLNIDASLYGKVFGINNQDKLAKVKENTSIKGMRAYFLLANSATAAKLNFGGELTDIDAVDNGEAVMTGKVYNLNGQYVGNSLEGLKKGVYIVNGKKVLK